MRPLALVVLAAAASGCAHGRSTPAGQDDAAKAVVIPREVHAPADRDDLLSPRDVLQRIEESPRLYEFGESEGIVDPEAALRAFWPAGPAPLDTPAVLTDAKGDRRVGPATPRAETKALLARVEGLLAQQQYAEAAELADQATAADAGDAWTWLTRGRVERLAGRPASAIAFLDKAVAANPVGAHAYALRAEALLDLRRTEEARRSFAQALALRPRDPTLEKRIRDDEALPFTVATGLVAPRVEVKPRGDDLLILVDATSPHWFGFGMCKALWRGEPQMRKERTGSEEHRFTALEEHECLVTLGVTYLLSRDNQEEEFKRDDDVERIMAVHEDQLENALVLYELASRRYPEVTLVVPDDQREQVIRFVLEYVLVPRGDQPAPDEDEESPTQRYEAQRPAGQPTDGQNRRAASWAAR